MCVHAYAWGYKQVNCNKATFVLSALYFYKFCHRLPNEEIVKF